MGIAVTGMNRDRRQTDLIIGPCPSGGPKGLIPGNFLASGSLKKWDTLYLPRTPDIEELKRQQVNIVSSIYKMRHYIHKLYIIMITLFGLIMVKNYN